MRGIQVSLLVFLALLTFDPAAAGKCPTGTVDVRGRVGNLPPGATGAEATVVVETKNGRVSRTASVSNGEFTVRVPFSTISSSSLLLGDRCKTVPIWVEVRMGWEGKTYAERNLNFKRNFEARAPYEYRLKEELSLDVKSGNNPK